MIRATNITKRYNGSREEPILDGADFAMGPGEIVALVGRSGCGKTTLLNLLGGLDRPDTGEISFDGRHLETMSDAELSAFRNSSVGFVFQSFFLRPRQTALDNVIVPLLFGPAPLREARERGRAALDQVGLAGMADTQVRRLSGGQRQRVAIARAIVNNPRLLLADEPTGNLDVATARDICDLLVHIRDQSATSIVLVTHDPIAEEFQIPLLTIEGGKVVPFEGRLTHLGPEPHPESLEQNPANPAR